MQVTQPEAAILKCISWDKKIIIGATSGTKTIASATNVFTGGISPDFKNWGLDVPGRATPATPVQIYQMYGEYDFNTIFYTLGQNLDKFCLEQEQIVMFVCNHRKWLRTDKYPSLFLLKGGEFVVRVGLFNHGTFVDVKRFSLGFVAWRSPIMVLVQTSEFKGMTL